MKPEQIEEMLRKTLDDYRFSRSERAAMDQIFRQLQPTGQSLNLYRSMAFDLARKTLAGPQSREVVEWLEDVVRLLQKFTPTTGGGPVAESHFSPKEECPRRIAGFIAAARKTIDICVFTITDDRIASAILETHRRGRSIRIVTDDEKAGDPGSDIDRLAAAGIPVRVDRSPGCMHHKFAVVDTATLLTGSYNWTRSAAAENEDNFIITGDRRFVSAFAGYFEKLWETLGQP